MSENISPNGQAINWHAIENFVGFGRHGAPIVFIGLEEGLSSVAGLEDDLLARSHYGEFEDLLVAQSGLDGPLRFFGPNPKCQRTWRPMCHLLLRREGEQNITAEKRSRYQADRLGRIDGDSLLCELMPYPNPSTSVWLYGERYPSREAYYKAMLPSRITLLRNAIFKARPEIVVCYGKSAWSDFQRLTPDVAWRVQSGFMVGEYQESRIVLAPHFSQRTFNTVAQLDTFSNVALGISG